MKSSTKKVLALAAVVCVAVLMSGCSVPMETDAAGNKVVKQIYMETTFTETMNSENWFSAIFVWPMAQMINKMAPVIGVAGAIAVLTILVNAILLAFTLKSQVSMQQMQLMQPEMEKIQRKYEGKDDDASKMRMAQEMQTLYGKYNVNPMTSMLIQFIQFPIIIAMYQAVQRASAVHTGTFMGLSLETTIWSGIKAGQWLYIIIFAIMGVLQYFSMMIPQKMSKKKAEEEAARHHKRVEKSSTDTQQKFMQYYMLIMILVFGLMWPAAMSVYWSIYSLVNIGKTFLVQKIIDKQNAKGAK